MAFSKYLSEYKKKSLLGNIDYRRSDVAVEFAQMQESEGIEIEENRFNGYMKATRVRVVNENGQRLTGKAIGEYTTVELKKLCIELENDEREELISFFSDILKEYIKGLGKEILVVGLGNWNMTPDALGPRVIDKLHVSRHIKDLVSDYNAARMKEVSALTPGVLGITGIETFDIIKGVVENTSPSAIIVIDALATRSLERCSTTLQISNTGIVPGSGVANRRLELSNETLGVPVIAIGIPTVVDGMTMALDIIEEVGSQDESLKEKIMKHFSENPGNVMVTPKEIDDIIEEMAQIISAALNVALCVDKIYD